MTANTDSARRASGIAAILLGSIGLVVVLMARHAESFRGAGSDWLLRWADRLGFITPRPVGSTEEARTPSLLSFTDETALWLLLGLGIYLGVAALLLAVMATRQREDSLYLGAGLVCGSLALVAANFWVGMAALVAGATSVAVARRL